MRHHDSHHRLLSTATPRNSRVDAIVVPAARDQGYLDFAIHLARSSKATLVVLCSRDACPDQVQQKIDGTGGVRGYAVGITTGYTLPDFVPLTSIEPDLRTANSNRASDLSLKRNLGLLLSRALGWRRTVFLDDDIRAVQPSDLGKLGAQLDRFPVAAMASTEFPDNSVVCHANRLAGNPQGVFVSGSVLAVDCLRPTVPFFPDVYNEDWMFFHEFAARREVSQAGQSQQLEYDPFMDPGRARREEFGDLLAEGLYDRLEDGLVSTPDEAYWEGFIKIRRDFIDNAARGLLEIGSFDGRAALSLEHARDQLDTISPEQCSLFLRTMQEDRRSWDAVWAGIRPAAEVEDALDTFGLSPASVGV